MKYLYKNSRWQCLVYVSSKINLEYNKIIDLLGIELRTIMIKTNMIDKLHDCRSADMYMSDYLNDRNEFYIMGAEARDIIAYMILNDLIKIEEDKFGSYHLKNKISNNGLITSIIKTKNIKEKLNDIRWLLYSGDSNNDSNITTMKEDDKIKEDKKIYLPSLINKLMNIDIDDKIKII